MAEEIDELYAAPLGEFTTRRNALAKERGDASIKQLRKPSVAAWAVNQLARRREVDLRRLLRAGEALEEAQKQVVRRGDQRPFEQARSEEREAVRRLRAAAAELLREGGHPASDQTLERVAKTLHAGAATDEGRAALREGRLSEELEPRGFEALAALATGAAPARGRSGTRTQKERGPSEAARRRAAKAREAADDARRDADEAAAALEAAARALDRLRGDAERAAKKAERLEAKARETAV